MSNNLNNEEIKNLAENCAKAQDVLDVAILIDKTGLWKDDSCWKAYGGNDNNFSTANNQGSESVSAIVEKIVNSEDAMNMKNCYKNGIDPKSDKAPSSPREAIKQFYGVEQDALDEKTRDYNKRFKGDYISICVDGSKEHLNVISVDNGEGQGPKTFEKTILSISASNKKSINCVIGKHNQGGTGSAAYCGTVDRPEYMGVQVIISKCCKESPNWSEENSSFVFTVTRRRLPDKKTGNRTSRLEYLVGHDGNPLTFKADSLRIIPNRYLDYSDWYYGVFYKMFDFQLPEKVKKDHAGTIGLNLQLSFNMPDTLIPFSVIECRPEFKDRDSYHNTIGLKNRLEYSMKDKKDSVVEKKVVSTLSILGGEAKVEMYLLKETTSKNKTSYLRSWATGEAGPKVIFSVNGQKHAHLNKNVYSRSDVALQYIADYLIIFVDCSNLSDFALEELFNSSRDRFKKGPIEEALMAQFYDALGSNEVLHDIQKERRKNDANSQATTDITKIMMDLLKTDRNLSSLFTSGNSLLGYGPVSKTTNAYVGLDNPTFFELDTSNFVDSKKQAQCGRNFNVTFKTDANNDFFLREDEPGEVEILNASMQTVDWNMNLHNGKLHVRIHPTLHKVGETETYFVKIKDVRNDRTWSDTFSIEMIAKEPSGPSGKRKLYGTDGLLLNNVATITKDAWESLEIDERYGFKIEYDNPESFTVYVNLDNKYLLNFIASSCKTPEDINKVKDNFIKNMCLTAVSSLREAKNESEEDPDIEQKILGAHSRSESLIFSALSNVFEEK